MHAGKDIERALAGELSEAAEARLREHLRGCEHCRAEYDRQVLLLRALAGDPSRPTGAERDREVRLALRIALPGSDPAGAGSGRSARWSGWPRPALVSAGLVLVLLAVGVGLWLVAGPADGSRPEPVAVVLSSSAALILPEPQGGPEGSVIMGAPVLSLAPRGRVELALHRGGRLRLSDGAQAALTADGRQLSLVAGRVGCQIDPGEGSFEVLTPSARVRVVGTEFDVAIQRSGATRVQVGRGEVEVSDRNGQTAVKLGAGQHTLVEPGAAPSPPARVRQQPTSEWELIKEGLRQAGRDFAHLFR